MLMNLKFGFLNSLGIVHVDLMECDRFGLEDDDGDEDAATQYMIEQSLLECSKQKETHRDSTTPEDKRSVFTKCLH